MERIQKPTKGGLLNRETVLGESRQQVVDVVWMKEVKGFEQRRVE